MKIEHSARSCEECDEKGELASLRSRAICLVLRDKSVNKGPTGAGVSQKMEGVLSQQVSQVQTNICFRFVELTWGGMSSSKTETRWNKSLLWGMDGWTDGR